MSARRRPNLFVVGAMKSGTTYLHRLLGSHPSIFMSQPDEPSYFVEPDQLRKVWPQMWQRGYWRSEQRYLDLFADAGDATLLGEASTNYSKLPQIRGVAARIAEFNPNARVVYVMRDPVDRAISHYWHMVRYQAEHRTILEAVTRDPQYTDVGHYAMQLAPYLDRFGTSGVTTLTLERLTSAPQATLSELYGWLGVDRTYVPDEIGKAEHETPSHVVQARGRGVLRRLGRSRPARALRPVVAGRIWRLTSGVAGKDVDRGSVELDEVIRRLRPIAAEQTEELRRLLSRDFPEWASVHGCK
jgi:Sulfotransferase family